MTGPPPVSLDEARRRLKDLGYLQGRVERFVFRRAFEGRGGLLLPAALVGAFAAALASLAAVESCETGFAGSLSSVAALLGHLFLANLAVAVIAMPAVSAAADRSRAPGRAGTLAGLLVALLVFALWVAGVLGLARNFSKAGLLWAPALACAALAAAVWTRAGFLARAYAHSRLLPTRPRGRLVLAAAALAGMLAAVAALSVRREPVSVAAPHPSPRSGAVTVVAVDGLADDATAILASLPQAAVGWWPAATAPPPEIWTDLATGLPAERHGVRALERVRPAGSALALRPPPGTLWYLKRLGPALGLVSSAPVSAADRRRLAFWEVAASAGLPSLAVGWWASDAWPGAVVLRNEDLLAGARDGLEVDRAARAAFRERSRGGDRVRTVYLPGPDILRRDAARRRTAITEIAAFLTEEISGRDGTSDAVVLLAADSHPTSRTLPRMVVFDRGGAAATLRIRPEDVAPSILARAGIPAARDLPGRPVAALFAPETLETASVETYGPRVVPVEAARRSSDKEYLEKLKSLGYLP